MYFCSALKVDMIVKELTVKHNDKEFHDEGEHQKCHKHLTKLTCEGECPLLITRERKSEVVF
jgi:hypothetical protein